MEIGYFDFGGKAPKRAHYNDAGADVFANESVSIRPHCTKKIKLGFGLDLPDGYVATIKPRSGLSSKGIIVTDGTIDSGFDDEICAIVTNTTIKPFSIWKGDRIAQIIIQNIALPSFVSIDVIAKHKKRGNNGFGSTGV